MVLGCMMSLFSKCKLLLIFLISLVECVRWLLKLLDEVFFLWIKYWCVVGVENLLKVDFVNCGSSS